MHQAQWTEHEARAALRAWKSSGKSLHHWALEHGIVPQRMRWWRKKLGDVEDVPEAAAPTATTDTVTLLPVQVTTKRGEPVAVYLRCGHIVKVGRGFDEDAFKRVVAILDGAG